MIEIHVANAINEYVKQCPLYYSLETPSSIIRTNLSFYRNYENDIIIELSSGTWKLRKLANHLPYLKVITAPPPTIPSARTMAEKRRSGGRLGQWRENNPYRIRRKQRAMQASLE